MAYVYQFMLILLVLISAHISEGRWREKREAASEDGTMPTPGHILEGMSKRGTVALQRRYRDAWQEVSDAKSELEDLLLPCKEKVRDIKQREKKKNEERRDLYCLPCLQGHCSDKAFECRLVALPDSEPTCTQVSDALSAADDNEKNKKIGKLCSYYQKECGSGLPREECFVFARESCLNRFQECAIESTSDNVPTCEQLRDADNKEEIAELCSYYRRECSGNENVTSCKMSVVDKCKDKIGTCDPCDEDGIDSVLCNAYQFGLDIKDFFTDDVASFFKDDVPDFFASAYSGVTSFFTNDFKNFFKEDVKNFFAEDVKEFFTSDVSDFFTEDVGEAWDSVKDFFSQGVDNFGEGVSEFGSDTRDFFSTGWDETSDFFSNGGDDVTDFFEEAAGDTKDFFDGAWDDTKDFGSDVGDFVEGAWDDTKDFGSDVGDFFEEGFSDVGDKFEDFGSDVGDVVGSAVDDVGDAFKSGWSGFKGLFSRRRRRRSIESTTEEIPYEPTCEELQNSTTRTDACLSYSPKCPCEFEEGNIHLEEVCPEMVEQNTSFVSLRDGYAWLLKIPRNSVSMKFKSFIIHKNDVDDHNMHAATGVITVAGRQKTFGTRIGLSREQFQRQLPSVLQDAIIALHE